MMMNLMIFVIKIIMHYFYVLIVVKKVPIFKIQIFVFTWMMLKKEALQQIYKPVVEL